MDWSGSDTHDSQVDERRFTCPECEAEIGTLDDWPTEEEEAQARRVRDSQPRDLEGHPTGDLAEPTRRMKQVRIYRCVDCGFQRELDDGEDYVICDKCWCEHDVTDENTDKY